MSQRLKSNLKGLEEVRKINTAASASEPLAESVRIFVSTIVVHSLRNFITVHTIQHTAHHTSAGVPALNAPRKTSIL